MPKLLSRFVSLSSLSLVVIASAAAPAVAGAPPPPIVGGDKVPHGELPDVVAVLGANAACSGTLIAPDVVLTAGHCIEIDPLEVIVDTVDYRVPSAGDRIKVKWAKAYPNWEHRYDVGIVVLEHVARPAPRAIATACLVNARLGAGKQVEVVGFGLTSPSATDDNTVLHQARVPVLDPTCATDPSCERSVVPNGEFTAGGRGTDSCFGDSGGPAMIDTPHGLAVAGVVSRGLALPGAPCGNGGVYVRADKVVAWIQAVTGRKLARVGCEGRGDQADPEIEPADQGGEDTGGCAAAGQGAGGLLIPVGALLVAIRRRRATPRVGAPSGPS